MRGLFGLPPPLSAWAAPHPHIAWAWRREGEGAGVSNMLSRPDLRIQTYQNHTDIPDTESRAPIGWLARCRRGPTNERPGLGGVSVSRPIGAGGLVGYQCIPPIAVWWREIIIYSVPSVYKHTTNTQLYYNGDDTAQAVKQTQREPLVSVYIIWKSKIASSYNKLSELGSMSSEKWSQGRVMLSEEGGAPDNDSLVRLQPSPPLDPKCEPRPRGDTPPHYGSPPTPDKKPWGPMMPVPGLLPLPTLNFSVMQEILNTFQKNLCITYMNLKGLDKFLFFKVMFGKRHFIYIYFFF